MNIYNIINLDLFNAINECLNFRELLMENENTLISYYFLRPPEAKTFISYNFKEELSIKTTLISQSYYHHLGLLKEHFYT